jgi:hypothetical protein
MVLGRLPGGGPGSALAPASISQAAAPNSGVGGPSKGFIAGGPRGAGGAGPGGSGTGPAGSGGSGVGSAQGGGPGQGQPGTTAGNGGQAGSGNGQRAGSGTPPGGGQAVPGDGKASPDTGASGTAGAAAGNNPGGTTGNPGNPGDKSATTAAPPGQAGSLGPPMPSFMTTPGAGKRPPPVTLSGLIGNRDWVIAIACEPDAVVLRGTGQRFTLAELTAKTAGEAPLAQAVRQLIARRQATVRPGEAPYRPLLRFQVAPGALGTYYLAYPLLEPLQVPMAREG